LKSTFSRWLPAIARNNARKAVLTAAGVVFVGAGIVGPTTAAFAGPAASAAPASTVASTVPVASTTTLPATAQGAPPAPAPAPAPASTPGEKGLSYDYMRQPNYFYCGPAATRIALTAIGKTPSQDDVAHRLGTTTDGTKSAEETTRVLNSVGGDSFYKTHVISGAAATGPQMDELRTSVVHAVSNNHAVVANIAGTVTDMSGDVHSYEGGHYLTIVGYGQGGMTVKIADPADTKGDGSYWLPVSTMANWIATRGYSA
jgi:Peptidase_C39 like family